VLAPDVACPNGEHLAEPFDPILNVFGLQFHLVLVRTRPDLVKKCSNREVAPRLVESLSEAA
jgi:hypothetical protein